MGRVFLPRAGGGPWLEIAGEVATIASAAQYLAPLELKPGILRQLVRHDCSGVCDWTTEDDLPGGRWSHCPRWVLRSAWWRTVVALWQTLRLCATIDTGRLAAWAFFGVLILDAQERKNGAGGEQRIRSGQVLRRR